MILSVLIGLAIAILNPIAQIQKSQDATRQHDLKQLQTAEDSYYNDNNHYPASLSQLTTTNIQTFPNDPAASSGWPNYAYLNDGSGNSQWNVLFAKVVSPSTTSLSCPLEKLKDPNGNSCIPSNYASLGYNYCVISGNISTTVCDTITGGGETINPLPVVTPGAPRPTSTPTPTPRQGITSMPVPFVCYCRDAAFWFDVAQDVSHQCQSVQTSSDPNVNHDRYCNFPCVDPCTP